MRRLVRKLYMYQILPTTPTFTHVENSDELIDFKFKAKITSEITYPFGNSKIIAIVKINYSLNCNFVDAKKEPVIFASAENVYSITKNDEKELEQKSETVFNCAKMLEDSFEEYLKDKGIITLVGIGIKPITYELWVGYNPENGIPFSLN